MNLPNRFLAIGLSTAAVFVALAQAQPKSAIEFYDTTGGTATARMGWTGNASTGQFFVNTPQNGDVIKTTASGVAIAGTVSATGFTGNGSGLSNLPGHVHSAADITSGILDTSRIPNAQYMVTTPGTVGQVWKSTGNGRGTWGTDLVGGGTTTTSVPWDSVKNKPLLLDSIHTGAVTTAKITDGAVTGSKIASGTIMETNISTFAQPRVAALVVDGAVGIGIAIPTAKLHVVGSVRISDTLGIASRLEIGQGSIVCNFGPSPYFSFSGVSAYSFNGTVCSSNISCSSDRRFKKSIVPLAQSLDKVKKLQGVSYEWDRAAYPGKSFEPGKQIGFIAQDVETDIPEVVITDKDGYKSLSYDKLTAVLAEAIKEQQKIIESQQKQIEVLGSRIAKLEAK